MFDHDRKLLLTIYKHALDAVNGKICVQDYLAKTSLNDNQYIIAIGKAASDMMQGAMNVVTRGLVITRYGYNNNQSVFDDRIRVIEAGHPVPDANSLKAGQALLEFISDIPHDADCLFLLSGGASALVEVLPEGLDIDDLEKVNSWLLGSGLAIHDMNIVRKLLSCIKGGRLTHYFNGITVRQLILSDVIGDQLDVIGSGLLAANHHSGTKPSMPDWVTGLINKAPPMPDEDDAVFDSTHSIILANNHTALQSAKEKALSLGIEVFLNPEPLVDDVQQVADALGKYIKPAQSGLYVFGGEPVVSLPEEPGRGGRMQTLALLLAQQISGRDDVLILCGATDGSDGSGEDAGALVDGKTIERGETEDFDIDDCICRADAGSFLEAAGDLLQTGPTGSNVNDLIIILKKRLNII